MDKNKQQTIKPGLYLVSTPIGNISDITYRCLNILNKSDIILCEDTRRSLKLLSHYKIKNKLLPYHKFNEKKLIDKIISYLKNDKIIALISDAGTPTISDPGTMLVSKCIDENLSIYPIPGPSAVTSAISISGFSGKYLFYGFLDKKENELEKELKNLSEFDCSLVFFVPAVKINFYISKFKKYFIDRKIVIAKEMTKIHEEFIRANVDKIESFPTNLKGELTIVLSKRIINKKKRKEIDESVKIEIKEMLKKYSHKDVTDFISKKENLPKKLIYNYCLTLKK
tara:strand:+ start:2889 stop:3737 length:849 start_codon:yes stop_codon:yes gene_type:complete